MMYRLRTGDDDFESLMQFARSLASTYETTVTGPVSVRDINFEVYVNTAHYCYFIHHNLKKNFEMLGHLLTQIQNIEVLKNNLISIMKIISFASVNIEEVLTTLVSTIIDNLQTIPLLTMGRKILGTLHTIHSVNIEPDYGKFIFNHHPIKNEVEFSGLYESNDDTYDSDDDPEFPPIRESNKPLFVSEFLNTPIDSTTEHTTEQPKDSEEKQNQQRKIDTPYEEKEIKQTIVPKEDKDLKQKKENIVLSWGWGNRIKQLTNMFNSKSDKQFYWSEHDMLQSSYTSFFLNDSRCLGKKTISQTNLINQLMIAGKDLTYSLDYEWLGAGGFNLRTNTETFIPHHELILYHDHPEFGFVQVVSDLLCLNETTFDYLQNQITACGLTKTTLGVHLRLGDRKFNSNLSKEILVKSILTALGTESFDNVVIVSDDINYANNLIEQLHFLKIRPTLIHEEMNSRVHVEGQVKGLCDMLILSLCKGIVYTQNSTFNECSMMLNKTLGHHEKTLTVLIAPEPIIHYCDHLSKHSFTCYNKQKLLKQLSEIFEELPCNIAYNLKIDIEFGERTQKLSDKRMGYLNKIGISNFEIENEKILYDQLSRIQLPSTVVVIDTKLIEYEIQPLEYSVDPKKKKKLNLSKCMYGTKLVALMVG